jgi:hypothetical protein
LGVNPDVDPRPLSHRTKVILGITFVLVLLAMLVVSLAYRQEGGSTVDGGFDGPGSGLVARVQPVNMDPGTNTLTVRFVFEALGEDYFESNDRLKETIWVSVDGPAGTREFRFGQGSKLSQAAIELGAIGDESQYPFDTYVADFALSADVMTRESDGTFTVSASVPVGISGTGGIPGWDVAMDFPTALGTESTRGEMSLNRAFSTQIFAILILVAVTTLSLTAMVLAFLIGTRRLPIESVLLPWMAGLLFALPILRNSMPNAPPIGIALDVYVFFWVLLTSAVAASTIAISWIRVRWLDVDQQIAQNAGTPTRDHS